MMGRKREEGVDALLLPTGAALACRLRLHAAAYAFRSAAAQFSVAAADLFRLNYA